MAKSGSAIEEVRKRRADRDPRMDCSPLTDDIFHRRRALRGGDDVIFQPLGSAIGKSRREIAGFWTMAASRQALMLPP